MTMTDLFPFGSLLKTFRQRQRLTQQRLARLIGVHRSAIIRWEQGDVLPASKTMVLELARQLHLGDEETRTLLEASLTALAPRWHVPFPRNPFFTGREEILETLSTHLSLARMVALTRAYALQGLGGVGKTQLALEYAYRHTLEYSAVLWIEAETDETAISSLLRIAEVLQLSQRRETDQNRVIAAVQRWLNSHSGWLLIWDNLEDLDLLSRLLPSVRRGTFLLTTRRQALGVLASGVDVAPMAQQEGLLFVLRRAKVLAPEAAEAHILQFAAQLPGEYAAARELVTAMGGLPLALDQAGAYIEETGCGFAGYLQRYQQQHRSLLARRGEIPAAHPLSLVATIELVCQRVAQQNPGALELLRFCTFLSPDTIPEELLVTGAASVGPVLGPLVADVMRLDGSLAVLRSLSLMQRQVGTHTLSLHRLVQVIVREALSEQEREEWQQRALHLFNSIFPAFVSPGVMVETWEHCEQLLPHMIACIATLPDHFQNRELPTVLLKMADYLHKRVRDEQAMPFYQRALRVFEQTVGPDHPEVGASLSKLAFLYRSQGKLKQAEALFQRAVSLLQRTLGLEHREVIYPLSGLATVYREQGLYAQAELLYQQALRIREQTLGPEHPEVAGSLGSLGIFYHEQGKYEQAEALYLRSLHIFEKVSGPEHPDLARAFNNLGNLYIDTGQYERAEPYCQQAVHIFEQALGPEHPNVAVMLNTLAALTRAQGQYEQARLFYQRALAIQEQALGPEHPAVVYSLHGLALLSGDQGDYTAAESLYQRALSLQEKHLGRKHPGTAEILRDLAHLRRLQGRGREAYALIRRALAILLRSLGEAHPKTIALRTLHDQLLNEMPSWEKEEPVAEHPANLPIATRNVAVRGAAEQWAYTRVVHMRDVTFTCIVCGQTVTQLHYPSGRIKYCSQACRAVGATRRRETRVARQREKRRRAREAQREKHV
jgi:tetratricopeptide (TPR) repeat protein/transcriptional regulator with XRE-family HTH domain